MQPMLQSSAAREGGFGTRPVMTRRLFWMLWVAAVVSFFAIWVTPVSDRLTRTAGAAMLATCWGGLVVLTWRRRWIRLSLFALPGVAACFLLAPDSSPLDVPALRSDYLNGLRRYTGVTYYWGGESPKGIDCSGLVRRGLIDSAFCRGLRSFQPSLVRYALWLWWHDCTASDLGEERSRLTIHVADTPSLNELDHSRILPGDLAVTAGGSHVMAYLGDKIWIEADPGIGRVVTASAPSETNIWFGEPMRIVRWKILQ